MLVCRLCVFFLASFLSPAGQHPGLREEAAEAAVPPRHLRGVRHRQHRRRREAHDMRGLPEGHGERQSPL